MEVNAHTNNMVLGAITVAKKAASLLGFLIGVLFWTSASADAYLSKTQPSPQDIWIDISGEITQRDLAFFRSHSKDFELKRLWVWLNSPGGDVAAAMEIGRIIRSVDGITHIPVNYRCYSSCALIFIAGIWRENGGKLGLHRPYFASAPPSREQIEKQAAIMRDTVKTYVEEMGITDNFFERIYNTDSSKIEILRGDQSQKIVPARDPVHDEIDTAEKAEGYGLTTSEYRKRDLLSDSSCPISFEHPRVKPTWYDCVQSIMWGISPEDYRSRSAKVKTSCGYSKSEAQLFYTTPQKDRRSLPFVTKHIACVVDIMSGK